jgi:hypothetical protein
VYQVHIFLVLCGWEAYEPKQSWLEWEIDYCTMCEFAEARDWKLDCEAFYRLCSSPRSPPIFLKQDLRKILVELCDLFTDSPVLMPPPTWRLSETLQVICDHFERGDSETALGVLIDGVQADSNRSVDYWHPYWKYFQFRISGACCSWFEKRRSDGVKPGALLSHLRPQPVSYPSSPPGDVGETTTAHRVVSSMQAGVNRGLAHQWARVDRVHCLVLDVEGIGADILSVAKNFAMEVLHLDSMKNLVLPTPPQFGCPEDDYTYAEHSGIAAVVFGGNKKKRLQGVAFAVTLAYLVISTTVPPAEYESVVRPWLLRVACP